MRATPLPLLLPPFLLLASTPVAFSFPSPHFLSVPQLSPLP